MTRILIVGLVIYSCLCVYDCTRTVEHINVQVTVQRGDTLQDIICDLQEQYGDRQDWRKICYEVCKAHGITKYIMPGQILNIPLEIKK